MKKIGKLSLGKLSKAELEKRQMNALRGGNDVCSCGLQCDCAEGGCVCPIPMGDRVSDHILNSISSRIYAEEAAISLAEHVTEVENDLFGEYGEYGCGYGY